jgi:4-carboxymuconolactone decarboxylase
MSAEPTFGRYAEIPLDQMTPQQREGYDHVVESRGEALGPYKIFIQNPALMRVLVPLGAYLNNGHSSPSDAEREIAVNLINGYWLAAYPNYRHEIFGEQAGLTPDKIEALIAGLPTSFDDPRQQVIYDLTQALIGPRVVPTGLYRRAVGLLGDAGVTDLTTLIGYYTTVSLTMAAYNVPADAVGLQRRQQTYRAVVHAGDIAEDFPVVTMDSGALDAARLLADHRLPGIVVTDTSGHPTAVLPASQVVRFIVPAYVQDDPSLAGVLNESMADRSADKLGGKKVREVLPEHWRDVPTVDAGDTIIEVAAAMARYRSPLLAVIKDGELHGVITASRLLAAALKH